MKKYNLSILLAVATLLFGGCQPVAQQDEKLDDVEVTDLVEDQESDLEDLDDGEEESEDSENETELKDESLEQDESITESTNSTGKTSGNTSSTNSSSSSARSTSSNSSNNNSSSNTGSTSSSSSNNNSSSSTGSSSSSSSNNNSSSSTGSSNNGSSSTPSTPPVVEQPKPQKPVDILDWNYIKSTLIAKGNSLGMVYEASMNRELDGYASPWQSSYMPVNNEDVIGYIGYQMEQAASWGRTYFNLEMVVQSDGNVLIYLIR